IVNRGQITGAASAEGIVLLGDGNTIVNAGTISVGASGVGLDVTTLSTTNAIINTGTISVGAGGIGISLSDRGTVFNSGTINAATGVAAIE
ncbi:hypothetical protein ABTK18_19325, partial [Acinetobacter baumannii]